jgi:hypothetical protein
MPQVRSRPRVDQPGVPDDIIRNSATDSRRVTYWTQLLLSDRKERLLTTGVSVDRLALLALTDKGPSGPPE